ncbi:MAG: tyrosine-type recombinase/integrase [Candidatus Bathyarchaeia archaeon]
MSGAPEVLSEREFESLLKAPAKLRDRLILCFLAHGFRVSEVCGKYAIRVMDINFDSEPVIFTVHGKTRQRKGRGREGKVRYVPLLSKWLRVFSRFESNLKRYIRENGLKPEDPLFNITDRQVRNLIKKYARKAGIPNSERVHPHMLRHTCATLLRRKGVPLRIIQTILGHASIKTTEIYDTVALYDVLEAFKEHKII